MSNGRGIRRAFVTSAPIDDVLTVLDLLYVSFFESKIDSTLETYEDAPFVKRAIYDSGYTRECFTRSDDYEVTPRVVAELRSRGLIQGTPHWGYTDNNESRISERGKDVLAGAWKATGHTFPDLRAHWWIRSWRAA